MRLERAPVVRHRAPGDAWWRVDLAELVGLVDGGDHVAAERLAAGMLRELDGTRGCGPRFGPGCSDALGPLEACDACRLVDNAMAKVQMLGARARLIVIAAA